MVYGVEGDEAWEGTTMSPNGPHLLMFRLQAQFRPSSHTQRHTVIKKYNCIKYLGNPGQTLSVNESLRETQIDPTSI